MSKPVDFPEKTHLLGPPEGAEAYVQDLPVHSDGMYCTSCWELDDEELREVAKTGGSGSPSCQAGLSLRWQSLG